MYSTLASIATPSRAQARDPARSELPRDSAHALRAGDPHTAGLSHVRCPLGSIVGAAPTTAVVHASWCGEFACACSGRLQSSSRLDDVVRVVRVRTPKRSRCSEPRHRRLREHVGSVGELPVHFGRQLARVVVVVSVDLPTLPGCGRPLAVHHATTASCVLPRSASGPRCTACAA